MINQAISGVTLLAGLEDKFSGPQELVIRHSIAFLFRVWKSLVTNSKHPFLDVLLPSPGISDYYACAGKIVLL